MVMSVAVRRPVPRGRATGCTTHKKTRLHKKREKAFKKMKNNNTRRVENQDIPVPAPDNGVTQADVLHLSMIVEEQTHPNGHVNCCFCFGGDGGFRFNSRRKAIKCAMAHFTASMIEVVKRASDAFVAGDSHAERVAKLERSRRDLAFELTLDEIAEENGCALDEMKENGHIRFN